MSETTDAAGLLLTLYQLRTEEALRRARGWFAFEFHPQSSDEVLRTWLGPGHESAPYRMVTTYWDMAASLVTQGAIPATLFNAANTEHYAVFAKLRPYLADLRSAARYPDYLLNLEQVAQSGAEAKARIGVFARYMERQRALAAEGRQRSYLGEQPAPVDPSPGEGAG